ncbi:MAG TPA: HAD-IIB family hydrolase [Dehalococcoidia bacterium]|nr:HAD-IIB family hydrolase [Dehalococcoidia bacterium]
MSPKATAAGTVPAGGGRPLRPPARFFAIACDYDGTLARDGRVDEPAREALRRAREAGRYLVLVTGRELDDLRGVFDELELFDWVVAENGGVLFHPESGQEVVAAGAPPDEFVAALKKRRVQPLSIGRVIVATRQPQETSVLEVVRDLGLERQVVFNKGAVMVLPSGTNKATGLALALRRLEVSRHDVAGIGDAENDHAFLDACELSAAVANALPAVRERVDVVMKRDNGGGVVDFIERLLRDDFRTAWGGLRRHLVNLGATPRGRQVTVPCYGSNLIFTGSPGGGKSTLAKVFLEGLVNHGYQFCVVDPEGDYEEFEAGVVLGDKTRPPSVAQVLELLRDPERNAVVNLLGMPLDDRPRFFTSLFAELMAMRSRAGRPHWLLLDEAHHLLPGDLGPGLLTLPEKLSNVVYVTIAPERMLPGALRVVDTVFSVGDEPELRMTAFAKAAGWPAPSARARKLAPGEAFVWRRRGRLQRFRVSETRFKHRRHLRKYAEGDLGPDLSFYFRGREGKLSLRAQNLAMFSQIAAGLDEDTWRYHLRRGDYRRWFRDVIKDEELVAEASALERRRLPGRASRQVLLDAINRRYATPGPAAVTS